MLKNRLIGLVNRFAPSQRECPCCGWRGSRFFDYFGKGYTVSNVVCPQCGSQPRHRGLLFFLRRELASLAPGSRVLHLAPERALASAFATRPDIACVTADLRMRGVAVRADATHLPFREGAFALAIVSHVLEHLKDDRAALAEIVRVTKPEGRALILVPMERGWMENASTREFEGPNPHLDNHWRVYGLDLADRIREAGFRCSILRLDELLPAPQAGSYRLIPEPLFVAVKQAG